MFDHLKIEEQRRVRDAARDFVEATPRQPILDMDMDEEEIRVPMISSAHLASATAVNCRLRAKPWRLFQQYARRHGLNRRDNYLDGCQIVLRERRQAGGEAEGAMVWRGSVSESFC